MSNVNKKALIAKFGHKFSVTARAITWTNGATEAQVAEFLGGDVNSLPMLVRKFTSEHMTRALKAAEQKLGTDAIEAMHIDGEYVVGGTYMQREYVYNVARRMAA